MSLSDASSSAAGPDGAARAPQWSRRKLLQRAGAAGAAVAATTVVPTASATTTRSREVDLRPGRPLLLRGGTVITMDPARGVLPRADVLVIDGRIAAIGPRLRAPADAAVLDLRGKLVQPGMIDTHRHMWQTVLRGIAADWTLGNYVDLMFGRLGALFTPDDMYAGSLLGAIEAIDSGTTAVVDWSHNMRTPQHADAVVDALLDSGARARLAYGNYAEPAQEWVLRGDIDRLRSERFPTADERVTLQIALDVFTGDFPEEPAWAWARDRGFEITTHAGVMGRQPADLPERLRDANLLLPSTTYVHATTFTDESYRLIAESGGTASVAAESDLHGGQGYPPTEKLRRYGIPTSLSVDTVTWYSGDMFHAMRATLTADRGLAHLRAHEQGKLVDINELRAQDVLAHATLGGARSMGLQDELGSLTPGKRADIVVLDTSSPNMTPMVNPVGAAVLQASTSDVDTVVVGGRVVKRNGELLGNGLARARRLADASRDRLRAAAGEKLWREALNPSGR